MTSLDEVLAWFDRVVPGGRAGLGLRPPADPAALAAYEAAIGVPLPEDARAMWLRHDGQSKEAEDRGLLPARWLSVAESRAMRSDQIQFVVLDWLDRPLDPDPRLRDLVYHPLRLPWASSYLGDYYVHLDLAPGPTGTAGQVIHLVSECDFEILGDSLGDLFARYAALARDGALSFDGEPRVQGKSLWDVLTVPPR